MTDYPPQLREHVAEARRALDRIEALLSPVTSGETLNDWAQRWTVARSPRIKGAARELERYAQWIAPSLGKRQVDALNRADVEAWIEMMEATVAAKRLRGTTAWRVWTVLRSMMRDASFGRIRELRVRQDNPTAGLKFERGPARVGTFLYPSEFLRLMQCERVPLALRQRYALAIYLFPRAGELAALEWDDIDLTTGRVHIHRALDYDGETSSTKTGEDRQFIAERAVLPLLRAMRRAARGRGPVLNMLQSKGRGTELRAALTKAGCKRADIHASDANRRPLSFHDLRATGITWQAMRGDSPAAISERVGHLHLSTTEIYMRRGRLLVAQNERVFPALPRCLCVGR